MATKGKGDKPFPRAGPFHDGPGRFSRSTGHVLRPKAPAGRVFVGIMNEKAGATAERIFGWPDWSRPKVCARQIGQWEWRRIPAGSKMGRAIPTSSNELASGRTATAGFRVRSIPVRCQEGTVRRVGREYAEDWCARAAAQRVRAPVHRLCAYRGPKRLVEVLDDEPLIAGLDVSGGGSAWNVIGSDAGSMRGRSRRFGFPAMRGAIVRC